MVEKPALDFQPDPQTGILLVSSREETSIAEIHVAFTRRAWELFSAWVTRTYEDGKVRWLVLEEANKPQ